MERTSDLTRDESTDDDLYHSPAETVLQSTDLVTEILRWLPVRSRSSLALLCRATYHAYACRHTNHYTRVAGIATELRYDKVSLMNKVLDRIHSPWETRPLVHDRDGRPTGVKDEGGEIVRPNGAPIISILAPVSYGKSFFAMALSLMWQSQESRKAAYHYRLGQTIHHPRDRVVVVVPTTCLAHVATEYQKHFPSTILYDDPEHSPVVVCHGITKKLTSKSNPMERYVRERLFPPFENDDAQIEACTYATSWSRYNKVLLVVHPVLSYASRHIHHVEFDDAFVSCPHMWCYAPEKARREERLWLHIHPPPGDLMGNDGVLIPWYDRVRCNWSPFYEGCLIIDEAHKNMAGNAHIARERHSHDAPVIALSASKHSRKAMDPSRHLPGVPAVAYHIPSRPVQFITIDPPILDNEVPDHIITSYMGEGTWMDQALGALTACDKVCILVEVPGSMMQNYHAVLLKVIEESELRNEIALHYATNLAGAAETMARFNGGLEPLPPKVKRGQVAPTPVLRHKSILLLPTKVASVGVNIHAQYALLITEKCKSIGKYNGTNLYQLVGRFVRASNMAPSVQICLYHGCGWISRRFRHEFVDDRVRGTIGVDVAFGLMHNDWLCTVAQWEVYGHVIEALLDEHILEGKNLILTDLGRRIAIATDIMGEEHVASLRDTQLIVTIVPDTVNVRKHYKDAGYKIMLGLALGDVMGRNEYVGEYIEKYSRTKLLNR